MKRESKKSTDRKKKEENPSSKKRILIATDSYLPRWDGVARFLSDIIPEIDQEFSITVIAPKYKGKYFISSNIKEKRMPLMNMTVGDYTPSKTNKKEILKEVRNCDILWSQTIGPIGSTSMKMADRLNKKIVAYIHSIEWELVSRSMNKPMLRDGVSAVVRAYARNLYNRCSLLMVPSRAIGDILEWKKIRTPKIVVPLGINTGKFVAPLNKELAKMHANISPKVKVIGFVGRIAYEKNLTTLVRAFIRLKDEYENIMLLIVGDGIKELKEKFSKVEGIKITGKTDDVLKYLQAMDIYVLPSLTETTSLSTLEAMSSETPPVVTPVGVMTHYVVNNVNGFKFSKENSFELVVRLRKLLDNPKQRERLGKTARQTVVENFSWKNTVKNIKDILRDLSS